MKKITMFVSALALVFTVNYASAQGPEIGIGAGISYPSDPDKVAFDSEVAFDVAVNDFFKVGIESGFGWIKLEEAGAGGIELEGATVTEKFTTNYYSIPLLAMFTLNLPMGEYSPVSFFISAGAGYSWTIYDSDLFEESYTFSGFTYQAVAGINYDMGEQASHMKLFLEGGYRGTDLKTDIEYNGVTLNDAELDMSGFIVRAGVTFPLGGGSDW